MLDAKSSVDGEAKTREIPHAKRVLKVVCLVFVALVSVSFDGVAEDMNDKGEIVIAAAEGKSEGDSFTVEFESSR